MILLEVLSILFALFILGVFGSIGGKCMSTCPDPVLMLSFIELGVFKLLGEKECELRVL
jgi:hypothetical protein|tara:strand:- start:186 stop:362 length:177 start_codon:yes stop_codon:yes gene_type:complete